VIGLVVTMVVLGFVPRIEVSPETLLVSRGRMLSSAEIVRDSVPVFSMGSSPVPLSSTLVKPGRDGHEDQGRRKTRCRSVTRSGQDREALHE
jgi:hypothetical protein